MNTSQFHENLRRIVQEGEERGVPVVIVCKPRSQNPPTHGLPESYRQHYGKIYGTSDEEIYSAFHDLYSAVQRDVASQMDHAALADAETALSAAEKEVGFDREGVRVFTHDGGHCTGLGYQKIAEVVAPLVAPEMADAIRDYIESAAYWKVLAEEFLDLQSPFEAKYAAEKAIELDPGLRGELELLIAKAEAQFEFIRLFEAGRWGGTIPEDQWEHKLRLLQQCQQMRPSDFGVLLQTMRVCQYTGHMDAAAAAMKDFKASSAQHQYQWLQFTFQSHLQGQRWREAEEAARAILAMNPNDQNARGFIRQLEQHRRGVVL